MRRPEQERLVRSRSAFCCDQQKQAAEGAREQEMRGRAGHDASEDEREWRVRGTVRGTREQEAPGEGSGCSDEAKGAAPV